MASVFVLPVKVVQDFDSLLRSYLLREKLESVSGIKVAWSNVFI